MLLLLNKVRQDRAGDTAAPTFGGWGFDGGHGKIDNSIFFLNTSFVYLLVPGYQPVDAQSPAPKMNI